MRETPVGRVPIETYAFQRGPLSIVDAISKIHQQLIDSSYIDYREVYLLMS